MVTRERGLALGILTADCVPVLFADAEAGVVGAAHAGWKGALTGVVEATVAAMTALGADRKRIVAGIGPAISQRSYEVGPEFPAPFLEQDARNSDFFCPAKREGHFLFDLKGYVARRLAALRVSAIQSLPCDTCAEDERFFSYRRACHRKETDYGRGLSAIYLEP
jgi:YfiH family protein